MAGGGVPGTGVVVGQHVELIDAGGVHLAKLHLVVVVRAGGEGHAQEEMVVARVLGRVAVEGLANGAQERNHVVRVGVVGRPLPIDIDSVKAPILDKLDRAAGKCLPCRICAGGGGETRGVCPATDTEEHLELTVGLLQFE